MGFKEPVTFSCNVILVHSYFVFPCQLKSSLLCSKKSNI